MSEKVVIIADPGIDTAFALALALWDPNLDVVGLLATPGNVAADRATQNIHILVNELDIPRWPRLGSAPAVEYETNNLALHGPEGLGSATFPLFSLHSLPVSDKLLVELVREYPKQITVVVLGPCTVLARAMDRDPELASLLDEVVIVGGNWKQPGDVNAVAEFHFFCDPLAARQVLHSGATITLLPLDVTQQLIFSPSELHEWTAKETVTAALLRQLLPYGIRASSNLFGIEGFVLNDVLGIIATSLPAVIQYRSVYVDVEVRGQLTRGMSVVDMRPTPAARPNVQLAISVDLPACREYIQRILEGANPS